MHCSKLVITLLLSLFCTKSESFFSSMDSSLLFYSNYSSREDILNQLISTHENLKIIILDSVKENLPSDNLIQWNDSNISEEEFQFYQKYSNNQIQTVAFHLPPGGKLSIYEHRPLQNVHLLVLSKNTPMHALLHEIGHFIIHNNPIHPAKSTSSKVLQNTIRLYEEAYIDMNLIESSDKFGFTQEEVCSRHKYMKRNLATLRSILKDFKPQNDEQKQMLSQLYTLSNPIKMMDIKYHTACFLF